VAGGNTIGAAPCSNIYGLKVFDDDGRQGYSSTILQALNVVKRRHLAKADAKSVVSMSLAGHCGSNAECLDTAVNQAIASMHAVGILFSVSAGNNHQDDSCSYFPASSPDAITAAASDERDNLASYSNTGACVDIIAPGSEVRSACARGDSDSDSEGERDSEFTCLDEQSYQARSGTSVSASYVAGTLAQLLEKQQGSYDFSPSSSDKVDSMTSALLCDAAKNKVRGVPGEDTPNLFLQVPKDDKTFNRCASQSMAATLRSAHNVRGGTSEGKAAYQSMSSYSLVMYEISEDGKH
jgi:subtilisin family serine protease